MDKPKPEIEEIVEDLKSYINTNMELYKMKATEKGAEIASQAIINIIIGVMVSMTLLFVSFALAYCLSEYFDKMYLGFLIVGGIYGVIGIFIYLSKDAWLKGTLVDNIIKSVYSH